MTILYLHAYLYTIVLLTVLLNKQEKIARTRKYLARNLINKLRTVSNELSFISYVQQCSLQFKGGF
jgi:hypothetical protein